MTHCRPGLIFIMCYIEYNNIYLNMCDVIIYVNIKTLINNDKIKIIKNSKNFIKFC